MLKEELILNCRQHFIHRATQLQEKKKKKEEEEA